MKTLLLFILIYFKGYSQLFSLTVKANFENSINLVKLDSILLNNSSLTPYSFHSITNSYPNCVSPQLKLYFSFKGIGNSDSAISKLNLLGLFSNIEKSEIGYSHCDVNSSKINDPRMLNSTVNKYHLDMIQAGCAWDLTKGDSRVVIGIADADFFDSHEDFATKIENISGSVTSGNDHGTYVASIAACNTNNGIGIAAIGYKSRLALRRIPHTINSGVPEAFDTDIRDAIWNLYLQGAPIINVSWSGTGLTAIAVNEMGDNGTLLIVSAGNTPTGNEHNQISNLPNVVIVSGVNQNNLHAPTGHRHNTFIDLCAPSIAIGQCGMFNTYHNASGTSFASPIVSGTAALLLSINRCLTPAQLKNILRITTDPIQDASLFPGLLGTGRLNAFRAVQEAIRISRNFQQNVTYNVGNNTIWGASDIFAGFNVTNLAPGNVIIPSGSNVEYRAGRSVELFNGFEVMQGGGLEVVTNIDSPCY